MKVKIGDYITETFSDYDITYALKPAVIIARVVTIDCKGERVNCLGCIFWETWDVFHIVDSPKYLTLFPRNTRRSTSNEIFRFTHEFAGHVCLLK